MLALLKLIDTIITLYIYVIIASAVMSWLLAFNVINIRNQFVYSFSQAVNSLTEPVFSRVRKFLPPLGGLDLSPVIVILALMFLRDFMWEIFTPGRF
jgi:YggT family protein